MRAANTERRADTSPEGRRKRDEVMRSDERRTKGKSRRVGISETCEAKQEMVDVVQVLVTVECRGG